MKTDQEQSVLQGEPAALPVKPRPVSAGKTGGLMEGGRGAGRQIKPLSSLRGRVLILFTSGLRMVLLPKTNSRSHLCPICCQGSVSTSLNVTADQSSSDGWSYYLGRFLKPVPVCVCWSERWQSEAGVSVQFGLTLCPLDGAFEAFTEEPLKDWEIKRTGEG